MAMDKARTRARSGRGGVNRGRTRRTATSGGGYLDTSVVPRVVVGVVNGLEIVVVGALRVTRDVLMRAISGAADIGAEALTAATGGVRGVVSAASRMVGDIAGTARGDLRETVSNVTHARRGERPALGEPTGGATDAGTSAVASKRGRGRGSRSNLAA